MKFGETFETSLGSMDRHYVVGPSNRVRIAVHETYVPIFYVSIEDLLDIGEVSEGQTVRRWKYREGTCERSYCNRSEAMEAAEDLWRMEREKQKTASERRCDSP